MKKLVFIFFGLVAISYLKGQNLQLHYDLGKDRRYLTTTIEMFKPDKWGSTFFFVDFDYNVGDVKGVSLSYMEIARGIKFWDNPFEFHIEYNGGFGQYAPGGSYQINDAWLLGGNYTWNNSDYSRIFTLQGMYKYIREKHSASFQITGVWKVHMANRKITFSGFADFWKEGNTFGNKKSDFVFLSEPQLWYNATDKFSIGGEIEIGSNFAGVEGIKVCPTIGAKWNF